MRIYRVVTITFFIMSLVLSCFIIGCSDNGSTGNGDGDGNGNGNGNGTPTISGELVGMLTYTTTWVNDPLTGTPYPRQTLSGFVPLIEDKDGKLFLLSAVTNSHFEYDGMSLSEIEINISGDTYIDYLPFNKESREVGGVTVQISHTGIRVAVTGTVNTVPDYPTVVGLLSGDMIDVETIEELS